MGDDMSIEKKKTYYCNVDLAIDIIGGKWKPLILYHLSNTDTLRFGAFKRLIPNVNERVLSRLLKELEQNEIIHREDFNENPPRVEYSLTEIGRTLSPVLIELGEWAKKYNKNHNYGVIQFQDAYEDGNC